VNVSAKAGSGCFFAGLGGLGSGSSSAGAGDGAGLEGARELERDELAVLGLEKAKRSRLSREV